MSIKEEDYEAVSLAPSSDSENLFEVERILDRRAEHKGICYLVKWEGYDESQATWEPETHLENVKWMLEEFNLGFERNAREKEREKVQRTLERQRMKAERKREERQSLMQPSIRDPNFLEFPKKIHKLTQNSPHPLEVYTQFADLPSKLHQPSALSSLAIQMAHTRMVRGNLSLDTAVKILGCRKKGGTIEYAVQFRRRNDTGLVILPQICSHEELKTHAPWLLSQYLLDSASVEQ